MFLSSIRPGQTKTPVEWARIAGSNSTEVLRMQDGSWSYATLVSFDTDATRRDLAQLKAPVLIMNGSKDTQVTVQAVKADVEEII